MMRLRLFLFLTFLYTVCWGQNTAKTWVMKVRKPRTDYTVILRKDTVLWTDHKNYFKIKVSGANELERVVLNGGSIRAISRNEYCAIVSEGGLRANLVIYVRDPRGKTVLGFHREYPIRVKPVPYPMVCGVKSDSVVDKKQLLDCARLSSRIWETKQVHKVRSFSMIYSNGQDLDTLHSANDYLSIQMKRAIHKYVIHGSVLQFDNIKWENRLGGTAYLRPMMIYVNDRKNPLFGK